MHTHRGAELSKAHPLIKHGNRTHYGKCPDNARRAGMVRARDARRHHLVLERRLGGSWNSNQRPSWARPLPVSH